MDRLIALVVLLIAGCAGSTPDDSARACTGLLYDTCLDEHDCASGNCHVFMGQMLQVCTVSCTPGDDTPCMTTLDGKKATCNNMGLCVPPSANVCTMHP